MAQELKENKLNHKLFFSINARGISRELIEKSIIPADVAALKKIGFHVEEKDLSIYNAFLALRAVQGKRILNNILDKQTETNIIDMARIFGFANCKSIHGAWLRPVQKALDTMPPGEYTTTETNDGGNEITRSKIHTFNNDSVLLVRKESGLDIILERIEHFLLKNSQSTQHNIISTSDDVRRENNEQT